MLPPLFRAAALAVVGAVVAIAAVGCGSDTAPPALNPVPVLTALSPDTASQVPAHSIQLTITGTGFIPTSQVLWSGLRRTTYFLSSTSLTAQILPGDLGGGTYPVTVSNPTPGGGTSNGLTFTVWAFITPAPTLTAISPDRASLGGPAISVHLTGSGFVPTSRVLVDGKPVATTFLSTTSLSADFADSLFATNAFRQVAVGNPPGNGVSTPLPFSVEAPQPVLTNLGATVIDAGQSGATLTVDGSGFAQNSVVRFAGAARVTTRVSPTRLVAQLLTADLRDPGLYDISVFTGPPGGGASKSLPFSVVAVVPKNISLPSQSAVVGQPVSIAVDGAGFVPGVVATIDGQDRPTTFVAWNRMTFSLSAGDVATPRTLSLAVRNPGTPAAPSTTLTVRSVPARTVISMVKIAGQATDCFYDSVTARLYAAMRSGPYVGRVIAVDPQTGQVTASVAMDEPGRLELSEDRQFLYVLRHPAGLGNQSELRRLSFPGLVTQAEWTEPVLFNILPMGSPNGVVGAAASSVRLYVDGLPVDNQGFATIDAQSIARGPDAQTIYGTAWLSPTSVVTMSLGSDGVHRVSSIPNTSGGKSIAFAGNRLYVSGGDALNPAPAQMIDPMLPGKVASFGASGPELLADPALGRLFLLSGATLTAFDLNTFTALGSVTVDAAISTSTLSLSLGRIAKWGTDGLVVRDFNNMFIFRTGLAAP